MRKTLLALALLAMGITTTTNAATLYLGDGSTADISGAFLTGTQNWDTTTTNWTPTLNPTAYTTFTGGDDAIFLGDLPIITLTENITVNNVSRETNVDDNANRIDFFLDSNALTIDGIFDGFPAGLDIAPRQVNMNGPGTLGGSFELKQASRIRLQNGVIAAPGTVLTATLGSDVLFISTVASDMSGMTVGGTNSSDTVIQFNLNNMVLGAMNGSAKLQGGASSTSILSVNPGAQADGTGIGAFLDDSYGNNITLSNGTHTFDIDGDTLESDLLTAGSITYGGTLDINLTAGTLDAGDVFNLFDAGSFSGSFTIDTNNWPALTSPLFWSTNNLVTDGTISVLGQKVDTYNGTLYLGNGVEDAGGTYTNDATWNTNSVVWGLGANAQYTLYTNWIDGSDAIFEGTAATRVISLASNLNVVVDELEWKGSAAIQFTGATNSTETITITNELRSTDTRQVTILDATLGGTFNVQGLSRLSIQGQGNVASNTAISILDDSDIQLFSSSVSDFTELTLSTAGSTVRNSNGSKTLGSLSGFGIIDIDSDTLTVNQLAIGETNTVAAYSADAGSVGDFTFGGGSYIFTLNPDAVTADQLAIGSGILTYAGDLVVLANGTNELALGDTFKLFDAGSYTGAFDSVVLPTDILPAGAVWNDTLDSDGSIAVGTPGIAYQTVNFTDFNGVSTWAQGLASTSGSITNGFGTVFTLTLSLVEHDGVTFANGYSAHPYATTIGGVKGPNGNARLDSFDATPGVVDTTNDEILRFELSMSGTAVDSLGLKSLRIESMATGEIAEFNDGVTTNTHIDVGGSDIVSYDDVLAGLTELTAANIGTWYLDVASRDNNNATLNTISFDDVQFLVGYQFQSAFGIWSDSYGLTEGAAGDDDGDFMSNLYEFGLGGDPTNPADTGFVEYGTVADGGSNYFEYVYAKRTAANSGIAYDLETTANLVYTPWTNDIPGLVVTTGTLDADFDAVTNRVPTTESAKFLQLIIEEN